MIPVPYIAIQIHHADIISLVSVIDYPSNGTRQRPQGEWKTLFNHIKQHKLVYGIGAFALLAIVVVFTLQGNSLKYSSKLAGNLNFAAAGLTEEKFGQIMGEAIDKKIREIGKNKWKNLSQAERNKKLKGIYEELGHAEWNAMNDAERSDIIEKIIEKLKKKYGLKEKVEVPTLQLDTTGTVDLNGITTVGNSGLQGGDTVDPSGLKKAPPKTGTVNIYTDSDGKPFSQGLFEIYDGETVVKKGNGPASKQFTLNVKDYKVVFGNVKGYKTPDDHNFTLEADTNYSATGVYVKTNTTAALKNTDTGTVDLNDVQPTCGTVIVERVGKGVIYLWDGNDKTIATISYGDPNVYTSGCISLGNYSVGGVEGGPEKFKVKSITDANGKNIQSKEQSSRSDKQKLKGGETIKFIVEFNYNKNESEELQRPDTGTVDLSDVEQANFTEVLQRPDTGVVDPSNIQQPIHLIPNDLP